jgi:hypothetical protein
LTLGLGLSLCLTACGDEASSDGGAETTDGSTTTSTGNDESTDGSGSTESGNETADGETGGETTGSFVDSDMMDASCGAECNIWDPEDCPEGEKCTSVACEVGSGSWDSNVCREIGGNKAEGDECDNMGSGIDGNDDCEKGNMCWGTDPDTGLGVCVAFCVGSIDAYSCASADKICDISNNGTLPLCLPSCDPLAPDCPGDEVCIPLTDDTGFSCNPSSGGGMAPNGTPCNYINDCNAGLVCADSAVNPACDGSASGCCTEICDLSGANTCAGAAEGQVCTPFYEMGATPPGYENVGLCAVPAPDVDENDAAYHQTLVKAPRPE